MIQLRKHRQTVTEKIRSSLCNQFVKSRMRKLAVPDYDNAWISAAVFGLLNFDSSLASGLNPGIFILTATAGQRSTRHGILIPMSTSSFRTRNWGLTLIGQIRLLTMHSFWWPFFFFLPSCISRPAETHIETISNPTGIPRKIPIDPSNIEIAYRITHLGSSEGTT